MEAQRIFVYGTLRQGQHANSLMGSDPLAVGVIRSDSHTLVEVAGGSFPGIIQTEGVESPDIVGEVYEVSDPDTLHRLDMYEGYPTLYSKQDVEVTLSDGDKVTCTTYIYNSTFRGYEDSVIPEGDWVEYINEEAA